MVGIIYEARPNVTIDAAAVCLKSGNAVILRGGSESLQSNLVLADAMSASLQENGIPADALQMVRSTGHEAVEAMLQMDQYIDVLDTRGGKGLIQAVAAGTRIPVIKHYEGICHLYIAADAPEDMAVRVAVNSKVQRVEVCNALETLLVDQAAADRLLPPLLQAFQEKNVELRGCERTRTLVPALAAGGGLAHRVPGAGVVRTGGGWHEEAIESTSTPMDLDTQTRSSPVGAAGAAFCGCRFCPCRECVHPVVRRRRLWHGRRGRHQHRQTMACGPVGVNELTSYKWVVAGAAHQELRLGETGTVKHRTMGPQSGAKQRAQAASKHCTA